MRHTDVGNELTPIQIDFTSIKTVLECSQVTIGIDSALQSLTIDTSFYFQHRSHTFEKERLWRLLVKEPRVTIMSNNHIVFVRHIAASIDNLTTTNPQTLWQHLTQPVPRGNFEHVSFTSGVPQ